MTIVTRAYKIELCPNRDKKETAFYVINRYNLYLKDFCREVFTDPDKKFQQKIWVQLPIMLCIKLDQ
jgi:hypothetical protein